MLLFSSSERCLVSSLKKYFTVFILTASFFAAHASDLVYLSDEYEEHLINPQEFEILEDTTGKLSFEEIRSEQYRAKFTTPHPELNSRTNTFIWVRFKIQNKSSEDKNWLLQLPLHADRVSLYIQSGDSTYKTYHTGQDLAFQSRAVDIRTLAFEIPPENTRPMEVFIRLYTEKYTDLSFILSNERRYLEVHTKGYLFLGLIYGILFLMTVYNLILYFSIRENIYIYYVLYTLSAIFFISWKDGLGFQFIWPEFPVLNNYHYNIGLFLLLITFMFFANDFLELKKYKSGLTLVTYAIIFMNLIYFLFNIFSDSFFEPLPLLYIISYFYFFSIALYFFFQGINHARYLLISLVCIITALIVIKLRYMGLLGWNWFIEYILNYAVAVEAVTMSLAISDKLKYLRQQEEKVKEAHLTEEKLKSENERIQLSHKTLEEDVRQSNNELTLLTTNLIQKTEFLNRFKKEIQSIAKESPDNGSLQKLLKSLDKEMELQNEWEHFILNFDKRHGSLLHRLQEKYPHLKSSDLLLCAYIKLNKSNKEIASLLNISVSGVEKKRSRLKEKMQLPSDDSLTDFILKMD